MTFGFENEYFVRNKDGKILEQIPSWELPHDDHCILVEVRSDPFENPYQTLASFNQKYVELEEALKKYDCTLACLTDYKTFGRHETAGFHIHFSRSPYYPTWNHDVPPVDIAEMKALLDERFRQYYEGVKRHPHEWRPKPYGWEYRRLPATVDPRIVTDTIAELFYKPEAKVA